MTAHQDVAGLVAELRDSHDGVSGDVFFVPSEVADRAADRLESLSQALREAEAERDRWFATAKTEAEGRQRMTTYSQDSFDRATAAESRLAEAMRVIGGLLKSACAAAQVMSDGIYRIDATEEEWLSHIAACQTARAFIAENGGKDE